MYQENQYSSLEVITSTQRPKTSIEVVTSTHSPIHLPYKPVLVSKVQVIPLEISTSTQSPIHLP